MIGVLLVVNVNVGGTIRKKSIDQVKYLYSLMFNLIVNLKFDTFVWDLRIGIDIGLKASKDLRFNISSKTKTFSGNYLEGNKNRKKTYLFDHWSTRLTDVVCISFPLTVVTIYYLQ